MRIIIFAHDPGSSNYGIAVLEANVTGRNRNTVKAKVLLHGVLRSPVANFKGAKQLRVAKDAYKAELRAILKKLNLKPEDITLAVAERYMNRGRTGTTIEYVNYMLGVLDELVSPRPLRLIPASQWKNELKRRDFDLAAFYKLVRNPKLTLKHAMQITPHETDACFIGVYALSRVLGSTQFAHLDLRELKNVLSSGKNKYTAPSLPST